MQQRLAILGGEPVRKAPFPAWPIHGAEEREALTRVLESGAWGLGNGEVERFEEDFARMQDAAYGICVTSGTVALRIALLAAGIGAGDEVVLPAYTFQATATAVIEANATPVFVDVDPRTYTMDPAAADRAVSPRTKVLMPVHFAGLPADLDAFTNLALARNLTLIEDAAQAHGARWRGQGAGSFGALGCFSFQSSKNLSCGEGGIILTNDSGLADRCRAIRNCGRADLPGGLTVFGNYRITGFQGAILNAQLARFEEQADRRDANARYLADLIRDLPGIRPQKRAPWVTRHATHLFSFQYDEDVYGVPRGPWLAALAAEGIPTGTEGYTVPLYEHPMIASGSYGPYTGSVDHAGVPFRKGDCPNAERACRREGAWLYQKLFLGTKADMEDIARAFTKLYECRSQLAEVEAGT